MFVQIIGKQKGLFSKKEEVDLIKPSEDEVAAIIKEFREAGYYKIKVIYTIEESQSIKVKTIKF